jgi:hypothetical protein
VITHKVFNYWTALNDVFLTNLPGTVFTASYIGSARTTKKTQSLIVVDACLPLCCLATDFLYVRAFAQRGRHRKQFPFSCYLYSCLQICCLETRWSNPLQYINIIDNRPYALMNESFASTEVMEETCIFGSKMYKTAWIIKLKSSVQVLRNYHISCCYWSLIWACQTRSSLEVPPLHG